MDIATLTRPGGRSVNEDSAAYAEKGKSCCLVVADGLGGHGFGEVASKTAVEAVIKLFGECTDMDSFLADAAEAAQAAVLKKEDESLKYKDMRTTLVILLVSGGYASWAHVGDSRLYMFRGRSVLAQTEDHSVPGMLVRMGEIKLKQIRNHPDRNRLIRVIGDRDMGVKYDISEKIGLEEGDSFLLCTDGMWELIEEKQMIKLRRKTADSKEWLECIAEEVERNGRGRNMDNFTGAALRVGRI